MIQRLLFAFAVAAPSLFAQDGPPASRQHPWDPQLVRLFQELPVQEEGRVKPLDTVVQYAMYRIQHKRVVRIPDDAKYGVNAGAKLAPMAWALDLMLYPEWSDSFPSFTLEDSATVLPIIGLTESIRRKRDRYSFDELTPGLGKLGDKYEQWSMIEAKDRNLLQSQVVGLGNSIGDYRRLRHVFDFARARFDIPDLPGMREAFGGVQTARASDLLRNMKVVVTAYRERESDPGIRALVEQIDFFARSSTNLRWIPPAKRSDVNWKTTRDVFEASVDGLATDEQIESIARVEKVIDAIGDEAALMAAVEQLHAHSTAQAALREEGAQIAREVSFYEADYFYKAGTWFVGAFLVLCLSWFGVTLRNAAMTKWTWVISLLCFAAANWWLISGIVQRCIVRGRPPMTGIYDTILFIFGVIGIVAFVVELITRRGLGLLVGSVLGALGMFLSFKHEMVTKQDTMPELIAVLDTNFWLSTHVTTVTMGYAAGLIAAGFAYVFLLGKLIRFRARDRAFYNGLGKIVYGCVCFGLLFSTVGTILGGVWANDSWGRFWGWDPKENGALMIVLWFLMVLHGRLGGYFRHFGVCLMSVLGAAVVAFSWWGVNLLGVGLHSYGFTSGIAFALNLFYGVTALMFVLGSVAYFIDRAAEAAPTVTDAPLEAAEPEPASGA